MLVHIIADYGPAGDLAFAEVVQRIKLHLPDAEPVLTPVPPFGTLAAGFCVAQLGLNDAPTGTIIYHNVAPRQDVNEAREANAGERLAFARLLTGVRVIGVNAGRAFSFVRDVAEELRWAAVPAAGSQFRSRDLFPQAAAAIALGHPDALGETIDPGVIPDVPEHVIAYIDGYGNLKTTLRAEVQPYAARTNVRLRIGGCEHKAIAGDGTFSVGHGQMAFAPGSSGWTNKQRREMRWMEIFLREGNAWETFLCPRIGDEVEVLA
jgi:S-adenosyl-l-methionine hydroxide adenosyltransferase